MTLRLDRQSVGSTVVVAVEGELDLFTAPMLRDEAALAIEQGGNRIVLDLSGVAFMDSAGLSAVIETWRQATSAGGGVTLAGPQPAVERVLRTTGLDRRLRIFADVTAALDGTGGGPSARGVEKAPE